MSTINLRERTKEFLDAALPNDMDDDAKVRQLIRAEYLRELGRFRRTDLALGRKYDLTFDEFVSRRIPQQMGYSWEVEQDAMAWETAVGGMATIERKLKELQDLSHEPSA